MPKGIAVDQQGRLKNRAAMSDTNLLLTITVVVFFLLSFLIFKGPWLLWSFLWPR